MPAIAKTLLKGGWKANDLLFCSERSLDWMALATMMVEQINLHVLSIGIYVIGLDGLPIMGWLIPKTPDISKQTNTHTHTHTQVQVPKKCKTHEFSGSLRFDPLLFSFIMGPPAISSFTSCFSQTHDEKPPICLSYG
jgi:hypothetical protein